MKAMDTAAIEGEGAKGTPMDREAYRRRLAELLDALPEGDQEEAVAFYMEAIIDRMDEGIEESEAVGQVATPEEAATEIMRNWGLRGESLWSVEETVSAPGPQPDASNDREDGPCRRFWDRLRHGKLTALEWVALVVTSPLWLSLVVAAASIALSLAIVALALYLCLWILIGCVWIIGAALVVAAPCVLLYVVWGLQIGSYPYGLVNLGYGLFGFGAGMWVLRGALRITQAFWKWQRRTIDARLLRKESSAEMINGSERSKRHSAFFGACAILAAVGLGCVAAGFLASGLDPLVFTSTWRTSEGIMLGGVPVPDPHQLPFFPKWL